MNVAEAPVRPRPDRTVHPSPMSLWRLLWAGIAPQRDALDVPLLAALFVFDPFRTAMDYPPLWDIRASVVVNKLLPDFVAFVAGVAARRLTGQPVIPPTWSRRLPGRAGRPGW